MKDTSTRIPVPRLGIGGGVKLECATIGDGAKVLVFITKVELYQCNNIQYIDIFHLYDGIYQYITYEIYSVRDAISNEC